MERKKRKNAGARNRSAPLQPTDQEQIRDLAYEIYETRHATGVVGDPVSDWLEAERLLSESDGEATHRKGISADSHATR